MTSKASKKLIYVLNYVHEQDVQHFVHVLRLLQVLGCRCAWSIRLLSEKGGVGDATVLGHPVRYLSNKSRSLRIIRLAGELISLRFQGYRLLFVRISLPAIITGILVGRLIGMKTVFWHSSTNHDLDRTKPILRRIVDGSKMWFASRGVDRFVTGPEAMIRYYIEAYGVPEHKLTLLYNDIDLKRFPATRRERAAGDPVRILFVHSFSPSKNALKYLPAVIDRLNRAAAKGMRIVFELAGDGPEQAAIAKIVRQAEGVEVNMLGAVPNTSLPDRYAAADLFIMPSYREGMPRALMEAMSTGLPAVSTDAGGTRDIVGPLQDRYVVPRDDHELFADRVYELLHDPDARQAIGEENIRSVGRYSTEAVADMYDAALSELLS